MTSSRRQPPRSRAGRSWAASPSCDRSCDIRISMPASAHAHPRDVCHRSSRPESESPARRWTSVSSWGCSALLSWPSPEPHHQRPPRDLLATRTGGAYDCMHTITMRVNGHSAPPIQRPRQAVIPGVTLGRPRLRTSRTVSTAAIRAWPPACDWPRRSTAWRGAGHRLRLSRQARNGPPGTARRPCRLVRSSPRG